MGKKKGKKGGGGDQQPDNKQQQQPGPSQHTVGASGDTQQTQKGPQQHGPSSADSSQEQQQRGSQQQQRGPQQQQQTGFQQQRGSQQQYQEVAGPQQQPWRPQQQKGPQQQQRGPQQQQQTGPQQRGPQQQQQTGPQQQRGPQQQQQTGPQQQQTGPQQQQRGPQQQYQEAAGPQQQPWRPQQQQQRGPQQQQQTGPQQQQQRGPQQQYQEAAGPQQQPWRPQQQQQQRGPQQQQQTGPQQQQRGPQQQQQTGPQQQQQRGPQQHQQKTGPSRQQQIGPQQQSEKSIPQMASPAESIKSASPSLPKSTPAAIGEDCKLTLYKPGTKGRIIKIATNYLAMDLGKNRSAIHYDVTITPETPRNLMDPVMEQFRKENYPNRFPAFDGKKNLYTPTLLPFGDAITGTVKVQADNGTKEFKVEIKFAANVDLSPLTDMMNNLRTSSELNIERALQCLDIVLRTAASKKSIKVGRSFFSPPQDGQIVPLGQGMEMYYGFFQSVIRGWTSYLNVDVAHKAFPISMSVLELICDLNSDYRNKWTLNDLKQPLRDYQKRELEKFLKTLKVCYEIRNQPSSKRVFRVNGLGEPAETAKFQLDGGPMITVAQYFERNKRAKLQYPHLPTLWVGSRDKKPKCLVPLEFCTVMGNQAVQRKMNENQTSAMIKVAATTTDHRKQKIMKSIQQVRHNQDPCVNEFGLKISNDFKQLEARVLNPPTLEYAAQATVRPQKGVWRADQHKFLKPSVVNKWTIVSVCRYPQKMDRLSDDFCKAARNAGLKIPSASPPFVEIKRASLDEIKRYFQTKAGFDLIVVVIPNSGPEYSWVKTAAEINVGCLTQCLKERTLQRLNPQTVGNILLKVNSKLDGCNHKFARISRPLILSRPCMMMGADVTHPSPDAQNIPSVAAVTASHDANAFCYNICWRLQPPRVEIIQDLKNIMIEQLKFFHKRTNAKPERIIFFRDGVSEGQFEEVKNAEIKAIQQACKSVQADGFEPKITFLVVQKRHHTRLFPMNPRDSEDRNNNVPAGTCVDTHIVNPTMQNFYLVSHASIQGVAKPTKYCTLSDDNKMTSDDIQELTYHLCHMFTRCNRSVSYPAPTYYAHLAAARAKVYVENENLDMERLNYYQEKYKINQDILTKNPMFFV